MGEWNRSGYPVDRAVFLDRDGVINKSAPPHQYITKMEQFEFLPGVLNALAVLAQCFTGKIIVVTNQAGIGKGMMTQEASDNSSTEIERRVKEAGGRIDRVYVCPHRVEDRCWCRKPRPGMFIQAEREMGIDLSRSIMVGDMVTDMQAAWAAGIGRCYWVVNEKQRFPDSWRGRRYRVVESLSEAVCLVVEAERENLRGSRGCPLGVYGVGSHHGAGTATDARQR